MPRRFLAAEWRYLLMLNYAIDPAVLRSRVPAGTEIDFWNGQTYVSMVGFRFLNTRVLGCRIPFHVNFDEINLRFYVRRMTPEGMRRGVVFIKEIVPRWPIAAVARWIYNENYVVHPMRSMVELPQANQPGLASYGWTAAGRTNTISACFAGAPVLPAAGSEAEFITEHYWGYARQRDGSTVEYRVTHPPWRVWRAENPKFDCDVAGFYGPEFVAALRGTPTSVFVVEGSTIEVMQGERMQ